MILYEILCSSSTEEFKILIFSALNSDEFLALTTSPLDSRVSGGEYEAIATMEDAGRRLPVGLLGRRDYVLVLEADGARGGGSSLSLAGSSSSTEAQKPKGNGK